MSVRIRLVIIIVGVILIGVGGGWLIYSSSKKTTGLLSDREVTPKTFDPTTKQRFIDSSNFSTTSLNEAVSASVNATTPDSTGPTSIELEKKGVESLARVFVEIYGSFSTDNNYQNVLDVKSFVTPVLWSKIKPPSTARPATTVFNGVTTNALLAKISTWSDTSTTVQVEAMRQETKGTVVTTYNQKAVVTLVKQETRWLVDSFSWIKP